MNMKNRVFLLFTFAIASVAGVGFTGTDVTANPVDKYESMTPDIYDAPVSVMELKYVADENGITASLHVLTTREDNGYFDWIPTEFYFDKPVAYYLKTNSEEKTPYKPDERTFIRYHSKSWHLNCSYQSPSTNWTKGKPVIRYLS